MKLRINNQSGFSVVEAGIILVVVAVIGAVGYVVYDRQQNKTAAPPATSQSAGQESATSEDVQEAPEINSTKDLDKAQTVLDQTDPEGSNSNDSNQLDSELSAF